MITQILCRMAYDESGLHGLALVAIPELNLANTLTLGISGGCLRVSDAHGKILDLRLEKTAVLHSSPAESLAAELLLRVIQETTASPQGQTQLIYYELLPEEWTEGALNLLFRRPHPPPTNGRFFFLTKNHDSPEKQILR